MSAYDNLLELDENGEPDPPTAFQRRGPGRPPKQPLPDGAISTKVSNFHTILEGVTIQFLQKAFRITRGKLEVKLIGCPALSTDKNGNPRYDLATASEYILDKPRDLKGAFKDLKATDLPENLRETFWNAKMKEAKYRVLAGELWLTEDVMQVLSNTFQLIKKVSMLWTDTIEETIGLTDAQRELQIKLVDKLMDDIKRELDTRTKTDATESFVRELDDEIQR